MVGGASLLLFSLSVLMRIAADLESNSEGDIFYLEILGRKIVIVNNYEMANELMDKRSANYSDRPVFPLFMKYVSHSPRVVNSAKMRPVEPRMGRQRYLPQVWVAIFQATAYSAAVFGEARGSPFPSHPCRGGTEDVEELA